MQKLTTFLKLLPFHSNLKITNGARCKFLLTQLLSNREKTSNGKLKHCFITYLILNEWANVGAPVKPDKQTADQNLLRKSNENLKNVEKDDESSEEEVPPTKNESLHTSTASKSIQIGINNCVMW